ncbi:MAG: serine protein kinase RIO [Thermoplasmata archaeon]|nr:serine protein kinase RIO [Candidatus Sysuiplasma acidicola]
MAYAASGDGIGCLPEAMPLSEPGAETMVNAKEDRYERMLEPLKKRIKGADDRKVYDQFFDSRTLMHIYSLMKAGIINTVDFPVATGKEGGVFKCTAPNGSALAMKVYRISNATFRSLSTYIAGDERFRGITGNFGKTITAWVDREFVNLSRLNSTSLFVPFPVAHRGNVLVMSYLGNESGPAPLLKDYALTSDEAKIFYAELLSFVSGAFMDAKLVHCDLSQYNVMVFDGRTYVIDCSQGITTRHPECMKYLKRDVDNINRFFRSKAVKVIAVEDIMRSLAGGERIAVS